MTRFLIVDDAPELLVLLRRVVEREKDFTVVGQGGDGQEALDKSRALEPDVLLLDLNMPVRSGLEVLPEIRAALPDMTIIVFSGLEEAKLVKTAMDAGADGYIEKGAEPRTIVDYIRSLITKKKA